MAVGFRSLNPFYRSRIIQALIMVNGGVFLAWLVSIYQGTPTFMYENFLVSWKALTEGRAWVLVTSVFSHNAFFHIFINMYVLHSFGNVIAQILGEKRFLTFYFFAGINGSLIHALSSAFLLHSPELNALGASGAIAGIIVLFSLLFPRKKILILGIIPISAIWGALAFIAIDLWGLIAQSKGGGLPIGHGAHLGGALLGLIYYFILKLRHKRH